MFKEIGRVVELLKYPQSIILGLDKVAHINSDDLTLTITSEECAELIQSITKVKRYGFHDKYEENLHEEVARLVEVWEHFRVPMNKNDKIRMKKTFSIINLDKCSYEFESPPSPLNGMYSITFFFKGKKVFREEYTKLGLAKARLEWFLSFEPKKQKGEFEYKGMMIDIDDFITGIRKCIFCVCYYHADCWRSYRDISDCYCSFRYRVGRCEWHRRR